MDDMRAQARMIEDLPVMARGIRAHYKVPFGRVFNQWDTNGDLWLWVNSSEARTMILTMSMEVGADRFSHGPIFGIPIYFEERPYFMRDSRSGSRSSVVRALDS